MKYIIMCGGTYPKFKKPKQLLKVNGEVLVERTIRLLKENGVEDISLSISSNNNYYDYLNLPLLLHENKYYAGCEKENLGSKYSWLNAFYPTDEEACYIYGDVYFSEEAIKTIVNKITDDILFFCIKDVQDGRETRNSKGREPLAFKVANQKRFRNAINDLLKQIDEGKFVDKIQPFSWHLYRYLNNMNYHLTDWEEMGRIFEKPGKYVVINDYTTDVDSVEDIEYIEKTIKEIENMVKVEVIETFTLGRFNELNNIQRKAHSEVGKLFVGDTFECSQELADYLTGNNALNKVVVKVIEVKPEVKVKDAVIVEEKEEKKTSVKKNKVAKKKEK